MSNINNKNIDNLISYNQTITENPKNIYYQEFNGQLLEINKLSISWVIGSLFVEIISDFMVLILPNNKHKNVIKLFSYIIFFIIFNIIAVQIFTISKIQTDKDEKKKDT
jgi:hypothetical protein